MGVFVRSFRSDRSEKDSKGGGLIWYENGILLQRGGGHLCFFEWVPTAKRSFGGKKKNFQIENIMRAVSIII